MRKFTPLKYEVNVQKEHKDGQTFFFENKHKFYTKLTKGIMDYDASIHDKYIRRLKLAI